MPTLVHFPAPVRVRANTWPPLNAELDRRTQMRLRPRAIASDDSARTAHIDALSSEWDFDRALETEASIVGLAGLTLGAAVDRLVLPAFVAAMLLLHATHGWYPLLPLFPCRRPDARRDGSRTTRAGRCAGSS